MAVGNLLFLLIFVTSGGAQDPEAPEVVGAVGGTALLNPQSAMAYSQIHWRRGSQARIAGRRRGEPPEYPPSSLGGRLELLPNATLRVSPLELGDSAEYRLYLEDDAGRESVQSVRLQVYDVVPKPQVTATTHGDPQQCLTTLKCSVPLQGVTYKWLPPQKVLEKDGPVLRLAPDPTGDTYVCKVTNPVSSNNSSLTFRPPCSWTESSSVTCATPSALVALGHLGLLLLLLTLA